MKATPLNIDKLPDGLHSAARNLYVRVRNKRPLWVFIYAYKKVRHELSLGPYPATSFPRALEIANDLRESLKYGLNPLVFRYSVIQDSQEVQAGESVEEMLAAEAKRAQASLARAAHEESFIPADQMTLSQLIRRAVPTILEIAQLRSEKHRSQWHQTLQKYVVKPFGQIKVCDVDRNLVLAILRPIWYTKTETATRVRSRLERVIAYAITRDLYTKPNPCTWHANLDMFLPSPEKIKMVIHQDALTVEETQHLFAEHWHSEEIPWKAVMFGILTCARVGEFIPLQWDEIDFEKAVWLCPSARRKDGKRYPHRVPLSRQAMALLRSIPRETEYVFGGRGSTHLHRETPVVLIKKTFQHGTMHGFRSTFRDWAAENDYDRVLAEKSLMHATGNEVEQAYQRSDLLERRRPLLQAWADTLLPNFEADMEESVQRAALPTEPPSEASTERWTSAGAALRPTDVQRYFLDCHATLMGPQTSQAR